MPKKSSTSVRVFYPELTQAEVIARLRDRLPDLAEKLPLRRVVLFGSYASGRFTAASDIDLLVVHEGPARDEAYRLVRQILGLPRLEPHVYTIDEYRASPTIRRMEQGGITILDQGSAEGP